MMQIIDCSGRVIAYGNQVDISADVLDYVKQTGCQLDNIYYTGESDENVYCLICVI
jgi:hypothetical protein